MARYDEDDAMSNYKAPESSSETKLRANAAAKGKALAKESYSEQRLRKGAKPMVKAKPKAKPVVGRAGAQTPGQRAKLGAAKSADAARAGAMSKPKASSTGGYPRPTAKKTSTSAKSVKKSKTTDPFAKFVFGAGRALKEPFTTKKGK